MGTTEGISVFDGRKFTNYTSANGLPVDAVDCILEDRTRPGTMLIGTDGGGVAEYSEGRFSTFHVGSNVYTNRVRVMRQDHFGVVWIGNDHGIYTSEQGRVRPFPPAENLGYMYDIAEYQDSLLFFACYNGLYVYSRSDSSIKKIDVGVQTWPTALLADDDGNLWVGAYNGLVLCFRGSHIVRRRKTSSTIYFFIDDHRGNLWVRDFDGVSRISKETFEENKPFRITTSNGLQQAITVGLLDQENNIWFGSWDKGLSKLSNKMTLLFPLDWKGAHPSRQSVHADRRDHIFIASYPGLWEIWRDEEGNWKQYRHSIFFEPERDSSNGLPLHPTYKLSVDRQGRLIVLFKESGLCYYEVVTNPSRPASLKAVQRFGQPHPLPRANTLGFFVDRNDLVWYSAWGLGIFVFDFHKKSPLIHTYSSPGGITNNLVTCMYQDRNGSVWLGTAEQGLYELDAPPLTAKEPRRWTKNDGLPDDQIGAFCEDSEGRLWVGTLQGGIAVFKDREIRTISSKDGLPSNEVQSLFQDADGKVWIGTGLGLAYRAPGSDEILRRSEITGTAVSNIGRMHNGLMYALTTEGLVVFDPSKEIGEPKRPLIHITRVEINGKPLRQAPRGQAGNIELAYNQNNCAIEFVGISFQDEARLRYQYKMTGIDRDWRTPTASTSVVFADLSPGKYAFQVRAVTGDGRASTSPASIALTIAPPFWKTWWFTALFWISALTSVGGTIRYLEMRKLRRRMRLLEEQRALDRERLRISQDMHDDVGARLTEIAILGELAHWNTADPQSVAAHTQAISEKAREVIDSIGEIIWAINPKNDRLEDLASYLREYAFQYLKMTAIKCHVEMPELASEVPLSADTRRNVFLIVKEALRNIIKHSGATTVRMNLVVDDGRLEITIEDNGRGFSSQGVPNSGNGLVNMQSRARAIGGSLETLSEPGKGTTLTVRIPLHERT